MERTKGSVTAIRPGADAVPPVPAPLASSPPKGYPPINSVHVLDTPQGEKLYRIVKSSNRRLTLVGLTPAQTEQLHAQLLEKHRLLDEMRAAQAAPEPSPPVSRLRRALDRLRKTTKGTTE